MKQIKLFDVTEDQFRAGYTNFTFENLFDALAEVGNPDADVTLRMHQTLYRRCNNHNLLDRYSVPPLVRIQGMGVEGCNSEGYRSGNIFDTQILHKGEVVGILRTREA
jgi:hypothetical protein